MRRKVKAGLIEADHADCAIVVHYEVEATVLGDMGEPIVAERQDNVKRIKLKTLNENTNIARLAQEMVEKCKLIHPSKLPLVERLLEELQEHQVRQERGGGQGGGSSRRQRPGTAVVRAAVLSRVGLPVVSLALARQAWLQKSCEATAQALAGAGGCVVSCRQPRVGRIGPRVCRSRAGDISPVKHPL